MSTVVDLRGRHLLRLADYSPDEIRYLRTVPALASAPESFFAELLPAFRFSGDVWAVAEGEVVFANEPILRLSAPAAESQLVRARQAFRAEWKGDAAVGDMT